MAKSERAEAPAFEQTWDSQRAMMQLDRRLTAEEASALDEERRAQLEQVRSRRFFGPSETPFR